MGRRARGAVRIRDRLGHRRDDGDTHCGEAAQSPLSSRLTDEPPSGPLFASLRKADRSVHMASTTKQSDAHQAQATARELTRENSPDSPVVQELRRQVANTFVLYANYKHYH